MENNNSVCFVSKINNISSIEGADKIQLAKCENWTSIVQKDIHKEGDLVLCITTDAIIPEELCEKWGIISYLRKGNRVRTIKLKGVYSECILIPLKDEQLNGTFEGKDLMNQLKIFKYEPPAIIVHEKNGRKHKYHQNPNFHVYYKFPNQKNTPNMFNEDDIVVITRKIHGTNARYGIVKKSKLSILDRIKKFFGNRWIDWEFVYGSHQVEKGSDSQGFYSTDIWKTIYEKYNIKETLWSRFKGLPKDSVKNGLIIYGEIYGPGIQGDKYSYGLKEIQLALFDIEVDGEYFCDKTFQNLMNNMNFPIVPYLYEGKWSKEIQDKYIGGFIENIFTIADLGDLKTVKGYQTKIPHEGVVVKSITGDRQKVSKVINPEYHTFSEKWLVPDSH